MSQSEEDSGDKPHEPTQKKLDDAREKGDVPRSNDLITAGSYAGLLLAGVTAGGDSLRAVGDALIGFLANPDLLAASLAGRGGPPLTGAVAPELLRALAPWALIPMAAVLIAIIGQRAFTVTGSKLQPKVSRISILSNAKNKFGRSGLFDFFKSFVKLAIYSVALGLFLWGKMPAILGAVALTPGAVTVLFLDLSMRFLGIVLIVALALGGIDLMWQQAEHVRKNRMSRKDLTDEQKQSEGDPHMKQERRRKGQQIAMNQMLADVPGASVVVVNPTHFAVALKWSRTSPGAPVCVAKGVDLVAARIREAAIEAGVPIHSDPPTARALHAIVEVGSEIHPDHYAAIAVAIRFAESMRRKAAAW